MREQRDLFFAIKRDETASRPPEGPDELDQLFMDHLPLLEPPPHLIEQVLTTIARFPDRHAGAGRQQPDEADAGDATGGRAANQTQSTAGSSTS